MAKAHNDAFKKNPRKFAEKYPMHPHGVVGPVESDVVWVQGAQEIMVADVDPDQGVQRVGFEEVAQGAVKTMHLTPAAAAADGFKSHYLPYSSGFIVEYQIPELEGDDNDDPDNPRFFFTHALSGCSVFVRGGARSPVVSHAGKEKESDAEVLPVWQDVMAGHLGNLPMQAVNKGDYQYFEEKKKDKDIIQSSHACVFGVREPNGEWKFYLQQNRIRMTISANGSKIVPVRTIVSQFYPAGPAQVHP